MTWSISSFFKKRLKTPTIIQMEATECGATALRIILAYYQCYLSAEEARLACGVSRDGSKAINILKAARNYGMTAQAAQIDELETLADFNEPLICYWGFNHFIVLEEVNLKEKRFYINDPAVGRRTLSQEEFGAQFTGIILFLKPSPTFIRKGQPSSTYSFLIPLLKSVKYSCIFVIIVSFLLIIPRLLVPGFSKIFVDYIILERLNSWFIPFIISFGLVLFIQGTLIWLQRAVLLKMQMQIMLKSVLSLFWHLLRLPLNFFTQRYVGDIVERLLANDRIAALMTAELTASLADLTSIFFFGIILMALNLKIGILAISLTLINIAFIFYAGHKISNLNYGLLSQKSKLLGIEINAIQHIENIKSSGTEDPYFKAWATQQASVINGEQQIAAKLQLLNITPSIISLLTNTLVISLGSLEIMNGHMSIGTLLAIQGIIIIFHQPLNNLSSAYEKLQKVNADINRLQDLFNHPIDKRLTIIENTSPLHDISKEKVAVSVENVNFGYSLLEPPIIHNIDFKILPKKFIAIVGSNGSGKSTIAKLLCGLYEPWEGNITLFGQNLGGYTASELSKIITYIDQDTYLFEGSIQENLTLWNTKVDQGFLEKALKDACIFEEVHKRGGLNYLIQEGGRNFSKGQCQRLEIARALVSNPEILILDEATSGLDYETEKTIFENLKSQNRTVILVSHRLEALTIADKIIVLEQGKIAQQGTYQQLSTKAGIFRDLLEASEENQGDNNA